MGVFTRSDHGLSNQKTFSDVDIIIYTEGGEISFNIDAILADDSNYNRQSIDIKFWDCILKKHNFKKRYKLKALGSKSCSKYFCEKIKNNEITGVAVFRDSDLDSILTTKYESNLICYTKGYSWENDVYSELVIIDYIESILSLIHI
ncbi:hypothetical protein C9J21_22275 [Photobacterium phosphoreum]|nr:hypothetical protein [Photobacterium phosphoreum]PSW22713.1 hypothetical protein C9J21_22275 [Photobacterium phosphoreum]